MDELVDEVMDIHRLQGKRVPLAIHIVARDNGVNERALATAVNKRAIAKRKAKAPKGPIPPGPDFKRDPVAQYYWDH